MKVLTVQQPAAGAIVALGKDVENRTWATSYRGPVAIQASARLMPEGHPFWEFGPYRKAVSAATAQQLHALTPQGCIVAFVDLVDVHRGRPGCCLSLWAEGVPFPVHWVLESVREVAPYPWRGGLGLRELPAEVEAELFRGIA